ncbi:MAG: DNA primase, partial [Clostridiales bacterium]|nr:DNA primase [Clostridiales bacterium]
VMEMENLSFPDAVRLLAKQAGMEVPETGESGDFRRRRERILALNKEAARYFHGCLSGGEGARGRAYLKCRALSKSTMTRFGLGWAPEGWDHLIRAMSARGYEKGDLLQAGLAVKGKEGGVYDRFRGRVMFPIIDLRGDVIGFGGRVLDGGEPKYLNSPETVVFNKRRNLFALNLARKSRQGRIILTEGYMDTIALHQAGFDCAVASLGTALTAEHAQLLARYTKEAVISYDGDTAGVSAAQRAIPILEKTGMQVKVLRMRGAKDPDEFIKTFGPEAFEKLLTQSENHVEYRLEQMRSTYNLADDAQRVAFSQAAAEFLATLPGVVEREVYGTRAAEWAGISPQAMTQEVKRALDRRVRQARRKEERRAMSPAAQLQPKARSLRYEDVRSARAEEGVVRLVLLDPPLFVQAERLSGDHFSVSFLGQAFERLRARWREGRSCQPGVLDGVLAPEEMDRLAEILQKPESLERSKEAMSDYMEIIESAYRKRTNETGADSLMAVREKYKKKKGYGGVGNE